MAGYMAELACDGYTSKNTWNILEDLTAIENRMAGQQGEKEGAQVIAEAFEDAGLREVSIDEFDLDGWWRGSTELEVGGRIYDSSHELIALPGTTDGEIEAELVDTGYGLPEQIGSEVEDKIIIARTDVPDDHDRWIHRLEKYAAAVRQGAAGFLLRNHVKGCLPPTGEIGWGRRPSPIPAAGISFELGGQLQRAIEEQNQPARLSVDCRNSPSTSINVEGVAGPDTEEEVLVTAHVDAHDIAQGARDNGGGCAIVAEIGRLLDNFEDELSTGVRFVTFGSEEIGLLGSQRFVDKRDPDSIKCVLNIDGAGGSRTPRVRSYEFECMESVIESVTDRNDVPLVTKDGLSPHTDAWPFAVEGIPCMSVSSERGDTGRGWGHTHADTLDKMDPRDLRDAALLLASTTIELANTDRKTPHKSREQVRELIEDHTKTELTFFDKWTL